MSPLALEMLVWFCTRGVPEAGPFPNIDGAPQQDIVRWMLDGEVIRTTGHAGMPQATEKGQAWLKMILDTPMPVMLWADPRYGDRLSDIGAAPASTPTRPASGPKTPETQAKTIDTPPLPEGFTPNKGDRTAPPEGVAGDQFIVALRRNGKQLGIFAGQVNWKIRPDKPKPDDTIGYALAQPPENKSHVGNSEKSKGKAS